MTYREFSDDVAFGLLLVYTVALFIRAWTKHKAKVAEAVLVYVLLFAYIIISPLIFQSYGAPTFRL